LEDFGSDRLHRFELAHLGETCPEGAKQISPGQSAAAKAASDALGFGTNEFSKP
jgi:hypothetical protein